MIKLPIIKEIKASTNLRLPIPQELEWFMINFDTAHRYLYGKQASKQQITIVMMDRGKKHVEKLFKGMLEEIQNQIQNP
jgi:hypothetical protein